MNPRPDHGEGGYKGSRKLAGRKAVITGGDSGIGRAVAIAFAREDADILIAYLNENNDADEVKALATCRPSSSPTSPISAGPTSHLPHFFVGLREDKPAREVRREAATRP